jgi:hypothetical protein
MKKTTFALALMMLLGMLSFKLKAQNENPEKLSSQNEAKTLYANFKTMYNSVEFDENGGTFSAATLKNLVAQMEANGGTEVVYRFGRTAPDKSGKNIIMFFNDKYTPEQLGSINTYKAINLCPDDCNPSVDNYLK